MTLCTRFGHQWTPVACGGVLSVGRSSTGLLVACGWVFDGIMPSCLA